MIFRCKMLAIAAVATMSALAACGQPDNSLRYKMTVEVDTPQGVRSGYAIREMVLSTDNIMRPTTGRIRGEAVAVDLPGGRTLFALLIGGDGDVDYAMQIGGRAEVWGKSPAERQAAPVELWPVAPKTLGLNGTDPLPMLVTFRDANDPKSVERIDPAKFETYFGTGVNLRRIELQATEERVTTGIGRRFGWWEKYKRERRRLNGSDSVAVFTNDISDNLSTGSFSIGSDE